MRFKLLVIMLYCLLLIGANTEAHSHTFFVPRSITTNSVFELSLSNYDRYHSSNGCTQFYIKPLALQSTNQKTIARCFLPNNKSSIILDESGFGNVDPLWFNLISPAGSFYSSRVSLSPIRTVGGAVFTLYSFFSSCWWFGINTALIYSKHAIRLCESDRSELGTCPGFETACQAFNAADWCAGKFSPRSKSKTRFDDIQLKFGYDVIRTHDNHATVYAVGTIPTGKKQKSNVVFEPVIGSNQGSLGLGFNGDYRLRDETWYNLNILADLKCRYVFGNTQRRSFDLCRNGDWSRYLLIVTEDAPLLSQPGISLLTFPVKVTPRWTVDAWLAVHYEKDTWHIELGYDFWWRQKEKVCKKCAIPETFGIQTLALCTPPFTSASAATICQAVTGSNATVTDAVFTPITNADINLGSGEHPTAISNTLYADIGYHYITECGRACLIGLGSSYEFGNKNALSQWAVWVTGGLSF